MMKLNSVPLQYEYIEWGEHNVNNLRSFPKKRTVDKPARI